MAGYNSLLPQLSHFLFVTDVQIKEKLLGVNSCKLSLCYGGVLLKSIPKRLYEKIFLGKVIAANAAIVVCPDASYGDTELVIDFSEGAK